MGVVVGIDLGTTFSAVAHLNGQGLAEIISNREGERITPSVVMFDGDSPIVGTIAKRSAVANPLNVVQFVKRQMGNPAWKFRSESGQSYSAEDVSAIILKRLREDAEAVLGQPVREAVITVPAYFDDAQRKATQDAGRIAGLNVLRIINEPTAAALAYAFENFRKLAGQADGRAFHDAISEQTVLVYDLGGGTFDVTIMRLSRDGIDVIATGGEKNLGGFDWDNEAMKFLNEQFMRAGGANLYDDPEAEQELRDKAEIAKKTLSSRDKATVVLSAEGRTATLTLTREDFDRATAPLVKRTASIMGFVLEDAGMLWTQIDKVLLTGGSTRMRAIPAMIERVTGQRPSAELHADEVVALGAAIQGGLLHVQERKAGHKNFPIVRVQDINSHSLGVAALDDDGEKVNSIIVTKGSPLPCKASDVFTTVVTNQEVIEVQVTEGEDRDLAYVRIVGEGEMSIPPYPKGAPIEVFFEYDHDGIIHVRVFDLTRKSWIGELHIRRTSNLTEDEVRVKQLALSTREIN